jgi:hypothetical protein
MSDDKLNREALLFQSEFDPIREALEKRQSTIFANTGKQTDLYYPIRATRLALFFDRKNEKALRETIDNPNLPAIWFHKFGVRIGEYAGHSTKETTVVPNSLSTLKIADSVIEGAEPWSDWKQYSRSLEMDAPKQNVPKTRYTDNVPGASGTIEEFAESGVTAGATPIGGKIDTIELDCSGTNNSYRAGIMVSRNDVKDNNFLAVEQAYKNAGNQLYFLCGKRIIDKLVADTTTNTDDRDNLDLSTPDQKYLEALIKVIRGTFKGTQRNTADSMFIHPDDASEVIRTAHADGGPWPFLDKRVLRQDNDSDVVNNSGLAAALGLRNVWETPQISSGTVMITKRDVAQVVGIREDLTIENLDQLPGGKYNSELVLRFDVKEADENGAYKITNFTA